MFAKVPPPLDIASLGQVFTPEAIVRRMLALRRNAGRVLEPSCGDGAFSRHLPGCTAIEIDARHCPPGALNQDFFAYPAREKFSTILGNPPYVRYQDIPATTRDLLPSKHFDARSNLYLFFIEKCLRHLEPGGELIFITPRDFLKATSAVRLNRLLHAQGTITDFIELGDTRVFAGATPNCAIWRFEHGNLSHRTRYEVGNGDKNGVEERHFLLAGGHLAFTRADYSVPLSSIFSVKVGAVSGADDVFTSDEYGDMDFVCSHTARDGRTRRMIFNTPHPALEPHKQRLLARRIKPFDESNWWQWGRLHPITERPRIYVNGKTRSPTPFFLHPCNNYDGAILALFPHDPAVDMAALCAQLNAVDWGELGFVCDGRFLFAQRSLQEALLPESFRCNIL
ncbi:MAG: class I SAM-dependent methyltransferase [Betaproteobacteria bacterium]|nr:class I SAM-dependent methyltransferase [Betaproteobacteria bacterium]